MNIITTTINFIWDSSDVVHEVIINMLGYTTLLALLASPIYAGILAAQILALMAMPVILANIIVIVAAIASCLCCAILACTGQIEDIYRDILLPMLVFCASLFCFKALLLTGVAILPAAVTAMALGPSVLLIVTYLQYIPVVLKAMYEEINETENKAKIMIAEVVGLVAMLCTFKFASAAIIAAVAPQAVAILGALSMAYLAAYLCDYKWAQSNIIMFPFRKSYPVSKKNEAFDAESLVKNLVVTTAVAVATFFFVSSFHITSALASMLIAAIVAHRVCLIAMDVVNTTFETSFRVRDYFSAPTESEQSKSLLSCLRFSNCYPIESNKKDGNNLSKV